MTIRSFERRLSCPAVRVGAWAAVYFAALALAAGSALLLLAQSGTAFQKKNQSEKTAAVRGNLPPQVLQAERFLARRGWTAARAGRVHAAKIQAMRRQAEELQADGEAKGIKLTNAVRAEGSGSTASWQPLGPTAVTSFNYGLVTGRISALALDPADTTGNTLYVGTTGGGLWKSTNAASSSATFTALTDDLEVTVDGQQEALSDEIDASISIGALTVQPGGTCVILAGTGDPNDALDSYYGAGILRSTDCGTSWSLIPYTTDEKWSFIGEGIAGFAFSTANPNLAASESNPANPNLVVAAVSQAYEGTLVNADWGDLSYEGLYYSTDAGASWHLATITDGTDADVQGPNDAYDAPDGNAATSVVWNPVRQLFIAAVRYHGYYQSSDGVTFTRMAMQPGANASTPTLTAKQCPTDEVSTGSTACPIYRGTLAVNPQTGDTFAWTVDEYNQDQGLWQDECAINSGGSACTNTSISFTQQWATASLDTDTTDGANTVVNGDYNLALAAVPAGVGLGYGTVVLAGANDLWKTTCPYSQGCTWRNTTNATVGFCSGVGEYQHALAWNAANPQEIFIGNDSGLWSSVDQIGETGVACGVSGNTDATHFENLNEGLGSLAEVESISQIGSTPYTMLAGLGASGTAGVKSTAATADWPEILSGEGGPVAINPGSTNTWYVNNGAGVSIHACSETGACTQADFGTTPVVGEADVDEDGETMSAPAPFMVDALDSSKLLVGTCRLWRGSATGGWSTSNAIGGILDDSGNSRCDGDALIRSIAALETTSGDEVIYVGMYGWADGGATLPGHVLSATINASGGIVQPWMDLTANTVTNDGAIAFNAYGLDISSIYIDPHDATGETVYVTVAGIANATEDVRTVYRSTNGGASWTNATENLPKTPANSLVVDPLDANTVYLATDAGVYSTRAIASCGSASCWSAYGSGLPMAPVEELSSAPATATMPVLVAATYGRGIWETALWSSNEALTTAVATPDPVTFASPVYTDATSSQGVMLKNTGSTALTVTSIAMSGDFTESDNCQSGSIAALSYCTITVSFAPTTTGSLTGLMTVYGDLSPNGQMTVALSGSGAAPPPVNLTPATLSFPATEVGVTSAALAVTANNSTGAAIAFTDSVSGAFAIASNACGSSMAAKSSCGLTITFKPTATGSASGTLSFTDSASNSPQTVALSGSGLAPPSDALSASSMSFPNTVIDESSAVEYITLANSGGVALTSISIAASAGFTESDDCTATLAAGAQCSIGVAFAPTATGAQTGTLTVSDAIHTQTVALSGTGVLPPAIGVSPTSLSFATENIGTAAPALTLTVSNTGGAAMATPSFAITGTSAGSYSTGTSTCGATLSVGASCTVAVNFTPAASGANLATLTVTSSTLDVTAVAVPLSGNGTSTSGINVSPAQLTFSVTTIGLSSAAQTVTISNAGASTVMSLNLSTNAPFSLTQNGCTSTLAGGANCTVGVVFTPTTAGYYTGLLTVTSSSTTAMVSLLGVGGLPGTVSISPVEEIFQQTGVNQASSPAVVTITNTGSTVTLTDLALAVTGSFELVNDNCPVQLAPGASCTTGIEFAPTSAGTQAGFLNVTSSALATTAFIPLSGLGFNFTVALSGSSTQTVANSQTAYYALVLTTLNGSAGTFTFACGSLPAYAACVFNPTTETVTSAATGNVTVEIETGVETTTARVEAPGKWRLLPLICGLTILPLAWRKRRKLLMLWALAMVLAGGISSCTSSGAIGGGATKGDLYVTPAGTYTIPITLLSNGVSQQVTVTLIVD